jgi:hypothetical protein
MSNTSYNFKDNLTIDNNKYLKWLDVTGTNRSNIIALDMNNNVNLNSASGQIYINSNNSGSNTFINANNNSNGSVIVASKLAIGFNSTSSITANLTLLNNGFIGVNTTQGTSNGYLGLTGSFQMTNTCGSRILLYGNDHISNSGQVSIYAGNNANGSVNVYTGNDSVKVSINNSGSTQFTPNGSTVRCNITDTSTTFSHVVKITDTSPSISSTSGALQIAGGIGVVGNCVVDGTLSIKAATGNINFSGTQASTSSTSGAVYTTGGIGISNSTAAVSVTSGGGLTVAGGAAVGKNMVVGGNVVVLDSSASLSSQTGSMVLYGGLGINNAMWSRTDSAPQIQLAPASSGSETSISFYATNNYSVNTGNANAWRVGQNVGNIGAGNFAIYSNQTGALITCTNTGKIGIATTNPSNTLEVSGTALFSTDVTAGTLSAQSLTLSGSPTYRQYFNTSSNDTIVITIPYSKQAGRWQSFTLEVNVVGVSGNISGAQMANYLFRGTVYNSNNNCLISRKSSNGNCVIFAMVQTNQESSGNIVIKIKGDSGVGQNVNLGISVSILSNDSSWSINRGTLTTEVSTVNDNTFDSSINVFPSGVGIGTTNPSTDLDINGSVMIRSTVEANSTSVGGSLTVAGGAAINKSLFVGGPILQLPSGNTAARPANPTQGTIRYNNQTSQFEGYGAGNNWGSLGGVIDVAQTTKILAEQSAGSGDGNLRFITNNLERMRINSSGNIGIGTSAPSTFLDVNGSVVIRSTVESVSTSNGGAVTINGGLGITKSLFVGGPILQLPSGNTSSRPSNPTRGSIRYNSQTDQFEGYGAGDSWGSLGGVIDVGQTTKILAELSAGAADGNLRFITNNLERMRINSSGNIGIGTSSPSSVFHINNVVASNNASIQLGNNDSSGWYLLKDPNGLLGFYTGGYNSGTFRFGCNSVGNFGINNNNPAYTLDVNGNANINSDLNVIGSISGSGSSSSTFAYLTLTATDEAINLTTGAMVTFGGIAIQCLTDTSSVTNGGSLIVAGGASIGKNLRVGLGITTGTITATKSSVTNVVSITTTTGTMRSDNLFVTTLLTAGNINVTNLTAANILATNTSIANLNLTNGTFGSIVGANFNINNATNGSLVIASTAQATGVGTGGSFTVSGGASFAKDVYVGGTMTSTSDLRLKTNIRNLKSNTEIPVLDTIDEIRSVIYNLRSEPNGKEQIGFIAQDFRKHYPQLLRLPDQDGYYSMDYSKVTVILLECIKELKVEVQCLREQLEKHIN